MNLKKKNSWDFINLPELLAAAFVTSAMELDLCPLGAAKCGNPLAVWGIHHCWWGHSLTAQRVLLDRWLWERDGWLKLGQIILPEIWSLDDWPRFAGSASELWFTLEQSECSPEARPVEPDAAQAAVSLPVSPWATILVVSGWLAQGTTAKKILGKKMRDSLYQLLNFITYYYIYLSFLSSYSS